MSKNLTPQTRENRVMARINELAKHQSRSRTMQRQGPAATRLAMVEGYLQIPLSDVMEENSAYVDFTAPNDATMMVGSLLYSTYMVVYNPLFPGDPAKIWPVDTSNLSTAGMQFNTWMPQSFSPDTAGYDTPYAIGDIPNNQIPDNHIRIASKANLQQGLWTTDSVLVIVYYQLRMTIGWS